jgi:hypothetical protein
VNLIRLFGSDFPGIMISLKSYATGLLVFATFFWVWALKNTIGMDPPNFDYGLVSFVTVMLSSSHLIAVANNIKGAASPGKLTRFLVVASCALVASNYMLGTYIGYSIIGRPGFALYCLMFVFLWLGLAGLGSHIMSSGVASSTTESHSLL